MLGLNRYNRYYLVGSRLRRFIQGMRHSEAATLYQPIKLMIGR